MEKNQLYEKDTEQNQRFRCPEKGKLNVCHSSDTQHRYIQSENSEMELDGETGVIQDSVPRPPDVAGACGAGCCLWVPLVLGCGGPLCTVEGHVGNF